MPNDPNLFVQQPDPTARLLGQLSGLDARLTSVQRDPRPALRYNRSGQGNFTFSTPFSFVATGGPLLILWQSLIHAPTGPAVGQHYYENITVSSRFNGVAMSSVSAVFATDMGLEDSKSMPLGVDFVQSNVGTNQLAYEVTSYNPAVSPPLWSAYYHDDLRITVLEF